MNLQPLPILCEVNPIAYPRDQPPINPSPKPDLPNIQRKERIAGCVLYLGEELPGPADGLLLEVVAEGPVPKHLKEGVVVGVLPHIVEVVVLPPGADALLGVAGAAQLSQRRVRGSRAEEDRLVLVHPGVGEQQRGVVNGDDGARRPTGVRLGLEVLNERLADPVGRPLRRRRRRRRRHPGGGRGCGGGEGKGEEEADCGGGQNPGLGVGRVEAV